MREAETGSVLVLAGATASGKTALAVELAESLGGEVVGADSIQVYRRLDIGSAKPTPDDTRGVRHHMLDVADLAEEFDAARFATLAGRAIADIRSRGRWPIIVGGAGLYIRALIRGLAEGIPSDPAIRGALNERAALGADELARMHAELAVVDPTYAAKIHPGDPIRIVRGLEVFALSGEAISAHHARHAAQHPHYDALFVALETDQPTLRARIAARTRAMLAAGWIGEVQTILADGFDPGLKPLRSVGYAEIVRHVLSGSERIEETEEAVVRATVAFAKRQRTWFRGEKDLTWVTPDALRSDAWRDRIRAHFEK